MACSFDRLGEARQIILFRNFDHAKTLEMLGAGLGIEQFIAALIQALDQGGEGDFAGVALVVEHAFAEESCAETYAVETSGELFVLPCFDAVGVTQFMQADKSGDEFVVDPGVCDSVGHAGAHGGLEVVVDADFEFFLTDELAEGVGNVELVERENAARIGGVPVHFAVVVGHGECALGVGFQE